MPYKDTEKKKAYDKAYRAKHRERRIAQMKLWRKNHPEKQRASESNYRKGNRVFLDKLKKKRQDNPEKYKARYTLNNHVAVGNMVRGNCEVCGGSENIHAHHNDYTKPLDVVWLCRKCHVKEHKVMV